MTNAVTLYFSLRSPYSWLALHRLSLLSEAERPALSLIPLYPEPGSGAPDPATNHARFRMLVEDMARMASAYGLSVRPPASLDTRWALPHAAFLYAEAQGCGLAFALAAGTARFSRGRDLAAPETLQELAQIVGLEPSKVLAAAEDAALQTRVEAGIRRAREEGVFGVPFFIFEGKRFWGNDRLDWLLREIDRANGRPVSDLSGDACFAPPWQRDPA